MPASERMRGVDGMCSLRKCCRLFLIAVPVISKIAFLQWSFPVLPPNRTVECQSQQIGNYDKMWKSLLFTLTFVYSLWPHLKKEDQGFECLIEQFKSWYISKESFFASQYWNPFANLLNSRSNIFANALMLIGLFLNAQQCQCRMKAGQMVFLADAEDQVMLYKPPWNKRAFLSARLISRLFWKLPMFCRKTTMESGFDDGILRPG